MHPAGLFLVGIIVFATVDAAVGDGAFRRFPVRTGYDSLCAAVRIVYLYLHKQTGRAVRGEQFEIAFTRDVEKAVPEHDADCVLPLLQLPGNIEGDIQGAFVILRPSRIEEIVADLIPVEEHIEMSESGNVCDRPLHRLLNCKLFPELGQPVHAGLFPFQGAVHVGQAVQSGRDYFIFPVFFPCDPFSIVPVFLRKKPHAEPVDQAPGRGISFFIPAFYFPVIYLSGFQFLSVEGNKNGG